MFSTRETTQSQCGSLGLGANKRKANRLETTMHNHGHVPGVSL